MSRIVHRADLINSTGGVSALCFPKPHPINMRRATWTNRDEAVTCPKCKKRIAEREKEVA